MTQQITTPARAFVGYSRMNGQPVALVESSSQAGKFHVTTATTCDCRGWAYRGRCSHLATVQTARGTQDGGAAHLAVSRAAGQWPPKISSPELARKYVEIWGTGE